MTRWRFFGDSHGCMRDLEELAVAADKAEGPVDIECVVGDFGFYPDNVDVCQTNRPVKRMFIRGNHEDHSQLPLDCTQPTTVDKMAPWLYIPDAHIESSMMFIGGAFSIDRAYRQSGPYRFHHNEQLTVAQECAVFDKLKANRADIKYLITHDCPMHIYPYRCPGGAVKESHLNTQAKFFNSVFDHIKIPGKETPVITWIFGHHHKPVDMVMDGVRFICLDVSHPMDYTSSEYGRIWIKPSPYKSTFTVDLP